MKRVLNTSNFIMFLCVLLLINVVSSMYLDLVGMRPVRVATTLILFIYFLFLKIEKRTFPIIAFSLLLLADIVLLGYENRWFCFLRFIIFIIIYSLLLVHIFNKEILKKIKPLPFVIIAVLFISCLYLITYLSDFIDFSIFGQTHKVLYYVYAVLNLLLILCTAVYSLYDFSKKTDVFLGAIVSFLISDLLLIIGYYSESYLAIQVERFFHIAAIGLITYYIVLFNTRKKNQQNFI